MGTILGGLIAIVLLLVVGNWLIGVVVMFYMWILGQRRSDRR
jgi:type IV secretory pathway TrbD component